MNDVTVLVVLEDEAARERMSHLLADAIGIEVIGKVGTAADAVDLLATLSPDVILMDAQMSGTNGVETTRILMNERRYPGAVVVLSVDTNDLEDAIESGAAGYLLKDARPDELLAVVQRATDGGFVFGDTVMQETQGMETALRYLSTPTPKVMPDNTAEHGAGAEEAVDSTPSGRGVGPDESEKTAGSVDALAFDALMTEVELVIAGPPSPAQVLKLYQSIKALTEVGIDEVVGSWRGDTVIKLTLRHPIPLLRLLVDMPEVAEVIPLASAEGEGLQRSVGGILGQPRYFPPPPRVRLVLEDP